MNELLERMNESSKIPFEEPKNNQERIENFRVQQKNPYRHPYTCGNDSRHQVLDMKEENGELIFYCKDCDYIQKI